MKAGCYTYRFRHFVSAVLMIMTLAWLTVSLPVVTRAQQAKAAEQTAAKSSDTKNDNSGNPFANTTEEKNPNVNTLSEEYLHESEPTTVQVPLQIKYDKCTHPAVYVAFHGELLSPPPEV